MALKPTDATLQRQDRPKYRRPLCFTFALSPRFKAAAEVAKGPEPVFCDFQAYQRLSNSPRSQVPRFGVAARKDLVNETQMPPGLYEYGHLFDCGSNNRFFIPKAPKEGRPATATAAAAKPSQAASEKEGRGNSARKERGRREWLFSEPLEPFAPEKPRAVRRTRFSTAPRFQHEEEAATVKGPGDVVSDSAVRRHTQTSCFGLSRARRGEVWDEERRQRMAPGPGHYCLKALPSVGESGRNRILSIRGFHNAKLTR